MPISTAVKYFHSAMAGAPTLNGTAGTLIAVLDACLINGFGTKTADSVVVAGGIATLTVSAGVTPLEVDAVALIAGATPAGLNGEKRILSATATAITFDATGISDQTATGTITAKLAPAGWEKAFAGTNLAAYRSTDVTGTRMFLRVDDTAAQNARVVGYEAMSDINTGAGPFPTAAQLSGGLYWAKANTTAATARAWTVIVDSKGFYLHTHTATVSLGASGVVNTFGDFASYKSGDAYSCVIHGATSDLSTATTQTTTDLSYITGTEYIARSFTGIGAPVAAGAAIEAYAPSGYSGGQNSTYVPVYPNGPDNALVLSRKILYEPSMALRGTMRGLLFNVQNSAGSFAWLNKIDGQGAYAGRKLMVVKCSSPAGTSSAALFFDVTGPWA